MLYTHLYAYACTHIHPLIHPHARARTNTHICRVLRMLQEHEEKFDYILVMDFDMKPWKAETVATAFRKTLPDWDMVCANGVMSDWDLR